MTREEFKAEILKANPTAAFIEGDEVMLCTPTTMLVSKSAEAADTVKFVVIGHKNDLNCIIGTSQNARYMKAGPRKRLMTPQECAGKWLVRNAGHCICRSLVLSFNANSSRIVIISDTTTSSHSVGELYISGWQIADSPTSAPYSLEVEE